MSGIDNIEKYFDLSKLKAPINELQAVALLSTGKEDLELKKHFINQIVSNTSEEDLDVCKNLDFYIKNQQNHGLHFSDVRNNTQFVQDQPPSTPFRNI